MRLQHHRMRGFTLIEVVAVIVIISVISVIVGRILFQGLNSFQTTQNVSEDGWQAFSILEHFTNDIHNMRTPASITTMSATQLNFTDVNNAAVQYQLSSGTLLRNSILLGTGVSSLAFGYLDKTGAVTATATAVRYVSISITLAQGNMSLAYSTLVGVRGTE